MSFTYVPNIVSDKIITPSNDILFQNLPVKGKSVPYSTPEKLKEVIVTCNFYPLSQIKFKWTVSGALGQSHYTQFFYNGSPYGAVHFTDLTQTVIEIISFTTLRPSDSFAIWGWGDSGFTIYDFYIQGIQDIFYNLVV
jgi:hypothetical protein